VSRFEKGFDCILFPPIALIDDDITDDIACLKTMINSM